MADAVESFLGPFGKWQLRSTLLIYLVKIPSAWFMACLIFTAKSPMPGEIFCKPQMEINDTRKWIQSAHKERFNRVENEKSYDFCRFYGNAAETYLNETISKTGSLFPCASFEHRSIYHSLIHQYELFCKREALVPLTQSFHLLGVLIGGIIAHYMLKRISPRRVMFHGMWSQIILGLMTGYATTYELHLFFRCAVAATCSLQCIGIITVSDISSGKYRVIAICMFEQFWSVGVILLPVVSTWWSSWSLVYVAISLPTFLLLIVYYWIPDSPRWLIKHGRVDEAKNILLEAAKVNGKEDFAEDDLDKQLQVMFEMFSNDPREPSWWAVWNGRKGHIRKVFAAHIGWSIYLMLYFALLLHVRAMGRIYLDVNTVIAGISEICGTFIGLFLILNTTKKWLWMSLLNISTSLISLSANFVPDSISPFNRMTIYMATAMLNKATVSTSLSVFITSMSEVVTKERRRICNYSGVTCSRTLVMIAPFIGFFVIFGQLVPQTIMSVMNISAALLIICCIRTPRTIPKPSYYATDIQLTDAYIIRSKDNE